MGPEPGRPELKAVLSDPDVPAVSPSVRAQILATEHWSLLATRSTTQSEVLSRISTFLMLVSASIVSLALIGQFTHFDQRFIMIALVFVGMLLVIGTLTQMRLGSAAIEDLALVIGMNRLRSAYVELDPGVERYFMTGAHDDDASVWQTYNPLIRPNRILQPLASTSAFILFLTSGVAGGFGALVALALGASGPIVAVVAAAAGVIYLLLSIVFGLRQYMRLSRRTILSSSPG